MKILVVDDDGDLRDFLQSHLPARGFVVDMAPTGACALSLSQINQYDLIILDFGLPDMTGEAVCHSLYSREHVPPILMLSAVSDPETKVRLLEAGADDYLAKPFSFDELIARLRALLRRSPRITPHLLSVGTLTLDTQRQVVYRKNKKIVLTLKEFALLEYLMRHQGTVVSKSALIEHVWDSMSNSFSNAIETHMTNLRKKVGSPALIRTIHSRGYTIG